MTEKTAKPVANKRTSKPTRARKPKVAPRTPDHSEISARAYYIYLEEGEPDALENWLRAERELTTA
jgi:Protein of unknown function (DUF2934)